MEKKTLEELLCLADENLTYDVDVHIELRNSKGERIDLFLVDYENDLVEVDYWPADGHMKTSDEYWTSWNPRDLCQYWGLDPNSTDWFVSKYTFTQLDDLSKSIEKLRETLSPYKGE